MTYQAFHRLALGALAAACLSLPAMASSDTMVGQLAQADTAPGLLLQEPMGGQFGGTTLGSGLEDGAANDPTVSTGESYSDRNDPDDDDRRDPGSLSALMFLIMAAGIGGGILLMHFNQSDTATGTHEYL